MRKGIVPFLIFALLDTVFILIGTVSFSIFLYAVNNGGFRGFLLFGVLSGMAVYHCTAGRIVMFFSEAIIRFLRLAVRTVIIKPVKFIIRIFCSIILWIWKHTAGRLVRIIRKQAAVLYTQRIMRRIHKDIQFRQQAGRELAQSEKTK